jgi:hypothetical protein
VEGIGGHDGAGQVQWFQELGEVAGLVVLGIDLEVVQQVPAVLGGAEQVNPGCAPSARRAPRAVLPSTATALNRPRASAFACCAARRAR